MPEHPEQYKSHLIEQAYLNVRPVVRVRREDENYYMTYKGGGMMAREEYNLPLDADSYAHLLQKADGNIITKRRYLIPFHAYTIELDVFEGLFEGIVVVDEAYSDFTKARPWRSRLAEFPNIIVLNTMSKAWGCAAIRLGMAFASKDIIDIFNKVKYPYNVNDLTQNMAMKRLSDSFEVEKWVRTIIDERDRMVMAFRLLPICKKVYPTDANFFLAKVSDATKIYNYLIDKGIVVRNRTNVMLCDNCLRITVGSKTENNELLSALRQYFD